MTIELFLTDKMFSSLRKYCSDELITYCFELVKMNTSDKDIWDVTYFVQKNSLKVGIIDKMNVAMSFLENEGFLIFQGEKYTKSTRSYLMTKLIKEGLITQDQECEIILPWIDCTEGEPFFEVQRK